MLEREPTARKWSPRESTGSRLLKAFSGLRGGAASFLATAVSYQALLRRFPRIAAPSERSAFHTARQSGTGNHVAGSRKIDWVSFCFTRWLRSRRSSFKTGLAETRERDCQLLPRAWNRLHASTISP